MEIIVASDSHGKTNKIETLALTNTFDKFIFCGDGLDDFDVVAQTNNYIFVSGNCDWFSNVPNELFFELCGKKIFVTHGNEYGVKRTQSILRQRAKELGADIVLFGHTHCADIQHFDGIYYVNPGALCNGDYITMIICDGQEPIFKKCKI